MKILYGIQLTGNGHIRRSLHLINKLRELGHTVDILTSGRGCNLPIEAKWKFTGLTLQYNNGSIDWVKTIFKSKPIRLIKEIKSKLEHYDLVISDFEPVSAYWAKLNGVKSISICNQNSITLAGNNFGLSKWFIKWFAKCDHLIGYDYLQTGNIFQPICNISLFGRKRGKNILVYLPYLNNKKVVDVLQKVDLDCIIYTNQKVDSSSKIQVKKCSEDFTKDLLSCGSVITHSGFSTTSEALILGKKIWTIPVKGQLEQELNCKKLKCMGVYTESELTLSNLKIWINQWKPIEYKWQDPTDRVIKKIIEIYEKD